MATYRDTDVTRAHPLFDAIADLRRLSGVERLPVDNLSAPEVVDLIASAAGHELDENTLRLADAVYAETEGNPFFVGEVLRHLVETGSVRREDDRWVMADVGPVDVPEGVRDVVGRRLNRLSATANEVLSLAAVVGREFDLEVLVGLVDGSEAATLDALDEGVRARLVEELDTERFRFAHALVRATLYEELSATRRRRLHRKVADVLEKVRPTDVRALAHHCTEAGPDGGDLSRALRYTLAAAEEALAARAFADADTRFRSALELLEDIDDVGSPLWVVARCGLGECLRDEGDPSFREVLLEATRRALELGDIDLILRAVLNNTLRLRLGGLGRRRGTDRGHRGRPRLRRCRAKLGSSPADGHVGLRADLLHPGRAAPRARRTTPSPWPARWATTASSATCSSPRATRRSTAVACRSWSCGTPRRCGWPMPTATPPST